MVQRHDDHDGTSQQIDGFNPSAFGFGGCEGRSDGSIRHAVNLGKKN
jgi:hypothetical protein